ncbi:MAG: hypothetical protein Aureis2KO_07910 [Aureisphaera sp.]
MTVVGDLRMSDFNLKQVQFSVLGTFVVIFGALIWYLNSDHYLRKEYFGFKDMGFKATLSKKIDEHPTKGNKIHLKNGPELIVYRELFDNLMIGDSIIKKMDSDSVFFYTSNGLVIDDYNAFKRKKYLNSLD